LQPKLPLITSPQSRECFCLNAANTALIGRAQEAVADGFWPFKRSQPRRFSLKKSFAKPASSLDALGYEITFYNSTSFDFVNIFFNFP